MFANLVRGASLSVATSVLLAVLSVPFFMPAPALAGGCSSCEKPKCNTCAKQAPCASKCDTCKPKCDTCKPKCASKCDTCKPKCASKCDTCKPKCASSTCNTCAGGYSNDEAGGYSGSDEFGF